MYRIEFGIKLNVTRLKYPSPYIPSSSAFSGLSHLAYIRASPRAARLQFYLNKASEKYIPKQVLQQNTNNIHLTPRRPSGFLALVRDQDAHFIQSPRLSETNNVPLGK